MSLLPCDGRLECLTISNMNSSRGGLITLVFGLKMLFFLIEENNLEEIFMSYDFKCALWTGFIRPLDWVLFKIDIIISIFFVTISRQVL